MQIWGTGAFDNSAATAWVARFDRAAPAARPIMARAAVSAIFDRDDEATAFTALAAAATVAAGLPGGALLAPGQGPKMLSDSTFTVSSELAELAVAALKTVGSPTGDWSRVWLRFERLDDALAVLDAVADELKERSSQSFRVRAAS